MCTLSVGRRNRKVLWQKGEDGLDAGRRFGSDLSCSNRISQVALVPSWRLKCLHASHANTGRWALLPCLFVTDYSNQ